MRREGVFIAAAVAVLLFVSVPATAQYDYHIFPQFADGKVSQSSYYRSTLTILPASLWSYPSCTLILYGMEAEFEGGTSPTYYMYIYVPPGNGFSVPTKGRQQLQTGYATLSCSEPVYASVIYSFYSAPNVKWSETTVFSSREAPSAGMVIDTRDGSEPALAIANNSNYWKSYYVTLRANGTTRSARVDVPARSNLSRLVHQILPVPSNAVGILTVESADWSSFSVVGFRLTGGVFAAVAVGN